jgi:hypothetical protein
LSYWGGDDYMKLSKSESKYRTRYIQSNHLDKVHQQRLDKLITEKGITYKVLYLAYKAIITQIYASIVAICEHKIISSSAEIPKVSKKTQDDVFDILISTSKISNYISKPHSHHYPSWCEFHPSPMYLFTKNAYEKCKERLGVL